MSIQAECARCGEDLLRPGGILFGPADSNGYSRKRHLCTTCYSQIVNDLPLPRTWKQS